MELSAEELSQSLEEIPGQCLAVRVSRIYRVVTNAYNEALRPLGLRVTQMFILVLTARWNGATPSQLCEALEIDGSTLSRNVERMKKKGWLEVKRASKQRGKVIKILPDGVSLLAKAIPAWQKAQDEVSGLLTDQGVSDISRLAGSIGTGAFPN